MPNHFIRYQWCRSQFEDRKEHSFALADFYILVMPDSLLAVLTRKGFDTFCNVNLKVLEEEGIVKGMVNTFWEMAACNRYQIHILRLDN